ncbi:restriction endonuclease subunit M [Alishewanella sp. WH16-1]|uniref:Eco57I restriction-modification methylase domain-containing protein n=1 Tax=Alishewanella sp. WH16-1 TaxID=1651088 RepID=UPI000709E0CB|nr:DNA methyltransferase [Alishewanella sp. WH16-1]KRS21718.1 restriction endonuclease subunit M [Alishewanella sp. WH16-1]
MRAALDKSLRSQLEKTVQKAREIVETAVSEVLERLGIADSTAPSYLTDDERKLRNRLRAHGRQLGDVLQDGSQTTELLLNEMAYEHWHRMLFARFLEQNHLLMYDPQTPVTIDECNELAADEGFSDGWQLAAKLAEKMLPQIFKTGSPVFDVKLPINHIRALEQLISSLHPDTFQASDSLGWCYQFWQTKKKKEINDSGVKIGVQELSPVTQLFTEPYMVSFLLDNALGAWWAKRRLSQDDLKAANSEQELRRLAAIPGLPLDYLRFVKDEVSGGWRAAAGDFDTWPEDLKEFKSLDPCCGSGHFLVAVFLMLVPMRMYLEGLSAKEAIDKVFADNIHGLELDQRCVELAAFSLALEAWRYPCAGGYRQLPELQLACSGLSLEEFQKEWKDLARDNIELDFSINWMQETFKYAPVLGSLIDASANLIEDKKPWTILQQSVNYKHFSEDSKAFAQGLSMTAKVLNKFFHFIATNPPYLGRGKQSNNLQSFCEKKYPNSKADLAFVFVERMKKLLTKQGVLSVVIPQSWLHQPSYKFLRKKIILEMDLGLFCQLGANAFESISGEVVNVGLFNFRNSISVNNTFNCLDLSSKKSAQEKNHFLKSFLISTFPQSKFENTPDNLIVLSDQEHENYLSDFADSLAGINCGDSLRFQRFYWEVDHKLEKWSFQQAASNETTDYSGSYTVFPWGDSDYEYFIESLNGRLGGSWKRGEAVWGKKGIAVNRMGELYSCIYKGHIFDQNIAVIYPKNEENFQILFTYIQSPKFREDVRKINTNLAVSNAVLSQVNFDIEFWKTKSQEVYPNGLSRPYTNDPIQWFYHGHPCGSVIWDETTKWTAIAPRRIDDTVLQVAIARLLGYQWPAELDPEMELADEMSYWLKQNSVFDSLNDDDGIVCIPSVRGEKAAADRVEAILEKAYAEDWSANTLQKLLAAVGSTSLVQYLRDKFFEQHCKIFQNRPFIWQIWDGLKDGFSVLVNYHKLDYKGLERLIYTYLGDWIRTQEHGVKEGLDGADIRLTAAKNLEQRLKAILEGEKGLDIFVRWKPLHEQPIGWNPDLNDGVRLNIRPFIKVADVGKKGAGVLRIAPKIDWKKDRGTDVPSAPWYHLGLEYGGKEGDRINDHYLSLAEKQAARAEQGKA